MSFTIGAVFQPFDNTSITIDYYDITIDDRLTVFNVNPDGLCDGDPACGGTDEIGLLAAAGIPNANALLGAKVAYFINGFESNISGIDLSIVSVFDVGSGTLTADLRSNFNSHDVKKVQQNALSASDVYDFENQVPDNRTALTFDYLSGGRFGGYVRFNFYGGWGDSGGQLSPSDASEAISYGSEMLVDIEARFDFNDNISLSVGAENVFDTEPEDDGHFVAEILGVDKALTSPFGFNGGFWYARLSAYF